MMRKLHSSLEENLKKSKSTKPKCLTKEGTLFRIINVITSSHGKQSFMITRQDYDREDIDSNLIPHYDCYHTLLKLYVDITIDEFNKLSPVLNSDNAFMVKTMDHESHKPDDFDDLTVNQLKDSIDYIVATYKIARSNKNTSGQHLPFASFVNGKLWLLYLNELLVQLGDTALMDCCYAELSDDALLESSNLDENNINIKPKRRKYQNQSEGSSENAMKEQLIASKLSAVKSLSERTKRMEQISINRRLNEVYELLAQYKPELVILRKKLQDIKNLKDTQEDADLDSLKSEFDNIKVQYDMKKKIVSNLEKEMENLQTSLKNLSNSDLTSSDESSIGSF